MADEGIRIGLIGAGRNTRDRHIPGFHEVNGVEIAAGGQPLPGVGPGGGRPVQHPHGLRQLAGAAGGRVDWRGVHRHLALHAPHADHRGT